MKRVGQAGLRGARLAGVYAPYSKTADAEGVVIAVRFTDDPYNVSKAYVEYDVRDLRTGQIYQNVRRVDQAQGMDDGSETILRPAQRVFGAVSTLFDPKTAKLSASDGDRVVLSFIYGAQHGAVIKEVLPHPLTTYGATKEDGFRRFETHKGTSVQTKNDGTYEIKRGDTTITLGDDETVDILHKSGSRLRFLPNGDIDIVPARNLLVGDANAVLPVARVSDNVQVTIPVGAVMVPNPLSPPGPPEIPNPVPIVLPGTIVSGSDNVKG